MPWTKAPPLVRVPLDKLHQAEKGEAGYIENDNDGLASHTFVKPIGGTRGLVNMQLAGQRIDCISAGD